MDFGNSKSAQLTERIMARITEHLKPTPDHGMTTPHHYNRVYEAVHAVLLEEFGMGVHRPVLNEFHRHREKGQL